MKVGSELWNPCPWFFVLVTFNLLGGEEEEEERGKGVTDNLIWCLQLCTQTPTHHTHALLLRECSPRQKKGCPFQHYRDHEMLGLASKFYKCLADHGWVHFDSTSWWSAVHYTVKSSGNQTVPLGIAFAWFKSNHYEWVKISSHFHYAKSHIELLLKC